MTFGLMRLVGSYFKSHACQQYMIFVFIDIRKYQFEEMLIY